MKHKTMTAEVQVLKAGQVLTGIDATGHPCVMIVGSQLMSGVAQEFENFRYDRRAGVLYLKVWGPVREDTERKAGLRPCMDCHSAPGTKVIYDQPDAGYPGDQELARRHLKLGKVYTVAGTDVGSWSSTVWFTEVRGARFNTVLFSPVSHPVGTVVGKKKGRVLK